MTARASHRKRANPSNPFLNSVHVSECPKTWTNSGLDRLDSVDGLKSRPFHSVIFDHESLVRTGACGCISACIPHPSRPPIPPRAMSGTSVLSFSELLESQLDDSLPYPSLKRLLRTLRDTHPAYPSKPSTAPPFSQTQQLRMQTQTPSEMHAPRSPPQSPSPPFLRTPNPFEDITNLPPRQLHEPRCRSTAREVGSHINFILNRLLDAAEHPVTWSQLRSELVRQSESYHQFCNSMDRMFACDDRLAVPPSCTSTQSSRACVYYSNLFWESAWREYSANFITTDI